MDALTTILTGLGILLVGFQRDSTQKNRERNLALAAIMKALTETKAYLEKYGRTGRRNYTTESLLVRLWGEASVPLACLDKDLARRCTDKSEYWLNPGAYSASDIKKLGIGIERINNEVKQHLARAA